MHGHIAPNAWPKWSTSIPRTPMHHMSHMCLIDASVVGDLTRPFDEGNVSQPAIALSTPPMCDGGSYASVDLPHAIEGISSGLVAKLLER